MGPLRWAVVIAGIAIAVMVAVVVISGPREATTWIVQPGETLTLTADEVHADDLYRCPGKGGVNGTPPPGHGVGGSGGFSVVTQEDGTVTASCEPGPPGNI